METEKLLEITQNRLNSEKENHVTFRLMKQMGLYDESLVPALKTKNLLQRRKGTSNEKEYYFSTFVKEKLQSKDERIILLKGIGGIGKTVTLLSTATDLIAKTLNIPCVYVPLNAFNTFTLTDNSDYIKQYLRNVFNDEIAEELSILAQRPWKKYPQLVLLLDGENEIVNTKIKEIESNIEEWALKQGVFIIVTTRFGISRIMNRVEFEFTRLSKESAHYYLEKAFGSDKSRLPKLSEPIYEVLDTPLMLNLYIQTAEYARIFADYPYAIWRYPTKAGHLIWNYLQKDICKCVRSLTVKEKDLNTAEYVFLLMGIAPFICYTMEEKGEFFITDNDLKDEINKAICFYSTLSNLPQQIESVQNIENEFIDFDVTPKTLGKYKHALTETLGIFHDTNKKLGIVRQYELLHQNFRDCLASIHLLNLIEVNSVSFLSEIDRPKTEYVLEYLSDLCEKADLIRMWDHTRAQQMNKAVVENILQIYGKQNEWNYRDLNWSGMDLSKLNFIDYRDPKTGKLQVSSNPDCFFGTKICASSFRPIRHNSQIRSVFCTHGNNRILSIGYDNSIIVWDATTLKPIGTPIIGISSEIHTFISTSDGKKLILGCMDGKIQVWDIESLTLLGITKNGHRKHVSSIALNPDETVIASGSADSTICLWNIETLEQIGSPFTEHEGPISCVCYCQDGNKIASSSADGSVRIWNVSDNKGEMYQIAHKLDGQVKEIQRIGNDKIMFKHTYRSKESFEIWKITANDFHFEYAQENISLLKKEKQQVLAIINEHSISFLDTQTYTELKEDLNVQNNTIVSAVFDDFSSFIATLMSDNSVYIWDYITNKEISHIKLPSVYEPKTFQFCADGKTILAAHFNLFYVIRVDDYQQKVQQTLLTQTRMFPIISNDHTKAILPTTDNMTRLWDLHKNHPFYARKCAARRTDRDERTSPIIYTEIREATLQSTVRKVVVTSRFKQYKNQCKSGLSSTDEWCLEPVH